MKTTRYRFESAIEQVKENSTQWLKDEFKSILESDKDFTRKADYIGFSIAGIDSKVTSIDEEIKELQQYKKRLKAAKDIALSVGAEVFAEYGIEKLEGAGISSITINKGSTKTNVKLKIINEEQLFRLGYFTVTINEEAIIDDLTGDNVVEELAQHVRLEHQQVVIPDKLRINKRKGLNNKIEIKDEEIAA